MKFSLEIGPKTEIDAVPALSDVYIKYKLIYISKLHQNDY